MATSAHNAAKPVRKFGTIFYWFDFCNRLPFGSAIFSLLIRWVAPYSASVSPRVRELREGYCRADITEKGRLKNPFNSVHAVALINIGELASGLLVTGTLENTNIQGIVTKLEAEYFKKAKGTITAISKVDEALLRLPEGQDQGNIEVITEMFDAKHDLVAKATARWTLRKKLPKPLKV